MVTHQNRKTGSSFYTRITILLVILSLFTLQFFAFQAQPVKSSNSVSAIEVKPGDWIEYEVYRYYYGDREDEFYIEKVEVIDIRDMYITFNLMRDDGSYNRTIEQDIRKLDISLYFIPAHSNLNDKIEMGDDTVMISRVEKRNCAGSERTVLYAVTRKTIDYGGGSYGELVTELWWDRDTGVLVEAKMEHNTTLSVKLVKTNIWEPQLYGIYQTVFLLVAAVSLAALLIAGLFIVRKKRKSKQSANLNSVL